MVAGEEAVRARCVECQPSSFRFELQVYTVAINAQFTRRAHQISRALLVRIAGNPATSIFNHRNYVQGDFSSRAQTNSTAAVLMDSTST